MSSTEQALKMGIDRIQELEQERDKYAAINAELLDMLKDIDNGDLYVLDVTRDKVRALIKAAEQGEEG